MVGQVLHLGPPQCFSHHGWDAWNMEAFYDTSEKPLDFSKSLKDFPTHIFFIVHIKRNKTKSISELSKYLIRIKCPSNSFSIFFMRNQLSSLNMFSILDFMLEMATKILGFAFLIILSSDSWSLWALTRNYACGTRRRQQHPSCPTMSEMAFLLLIELRFLEAPLPGVIVLWSDGSALSFMDNMQCCIAWNTTKGLRLQWHFGSLSSSHADIFFRHRHSSL